MITRDLADHGGWQAGCAGAPPPLHVHDDNPEANWYPAVRPAIRPTPPGPVMVRIPNPVPFGDDPLDATMQTAPRHHTAGMVGRLNHEGAVQ